MRAVAGAKPSAEIATAAGVGATSITVEVVVYAERGLRQGSIEGTVDKVAEATLTYVAIDANYRKRPVPPEVR